IEELTGYVEGKALRKKNVQAIAQFIWDEVITRHSNELNIDQRFVASYHPEANSHSERTVQKFTRIIRKVCAEKQNRWHKYIRSAIWAINIMVNDLGYSPFHLVYGCDAITLVQLMLESYQVYLSELDGSELRDPITRNRVKKLFTWEKKVPSQSGYSDQSSVALEDEDQR
ncbi:19748_t:CDS:2, partial [Cetraspora pellucida]